MSAEPRQVASADFWTRWEHQVVNGIFPLHRLLGCSDRAAVFLTEHKARNLPNAAIKLVRTDGLGATAQLKHWKAAAELSHPHLVRLFEMGRWRPGRREFVFVVMEYAEQTLDQILSRRALTADEVREMLPPALDALAYLHSRQRVHGQLRPSNFLAVDDQLKLASDNIRLPGPSGEGGLRLSWFDPPERNETGPSAAGDVWGFGMTLVQALTLATPTWPDQRSETAALPANLPTPFVGLVRRCLSRTPANRPTVLELEAPFKSALKANSAAHAPAPTLTPPPKAAKAGKVTKATETKVVQPQGGRKRNVWLLTTAAAALIAVAGWVRLPEMSATPQPPPLASVAAPVIEEVAPPSPQPEVQPTDPFADLLEVTAEETVAVTEEPVSPVLYEAKPTVPPEISARIQGTADVSLRVLVDPLGDVIGTMMENPGRNKQLASLADAAAWDWKFVGSNERDSRVWLLRFQFTRDGVVASASEQ